MRIAVPASVALHLSLIAGAYLMLYWSEPPDETSVESVSVDIVSMQEFTSNAVSETESTATENAVSAGAEAVASLELVPVDEIGPEEPPVERPEPDKAVEIPDAQPVTPDPVTAEIQTVDPTGAKRPDYAQSETIDPLEVASAQVLTAALGSAEPIEGALPPESAAPVEQVAATKPAAIKPVELEPADMISATIQPAVEQLQPARSPSAEVAEIAPASAALAVQLSAITPDRPDRLEPVEEADAAPVPMARTALQVKEPTSEQVPQKKPPAKQPAPTKKPSAPAGAGGKSNVDSQASAPSGGKGQSDASGNAQVSRYPGLVQAKLRRALRYPSGAGRISGEVQVQFVVSASGSVSGLTVVRSSGHAALDEAAMATVRRAAPFAPIPSAAGKSSWTFVMPLLFQR